MAKQECIRPLEAWRRGALFAALFLMGVGPTLAWGENPDDKTGGTGFPSGSSLRAIISGEGAPPPHSSKKPVEPNLGPSNWGQEGGSETRNPFFPGLPSKPKSDLASTSGSLPPQPGESDGGTIPATQPKAHAGIHWSSRFGATPLSLLEYRFSHQPLVVGGRVLLTSTRGQVLCLDAATGSLLWHSRLPESVWASGVADDQAFYVVSGTPFVTAPHMMGYAQTRKIRRGEGPGHLYALSLLSGKVLWSAEVPGPAIGSPVLEGGKVWVSTGNGHLLGFSVEREKKILDMSLFSSSGWSSPLFVHHWLWVSLEGPTKLVALWPDKKRTVWSLTTPPTERLVLFTPTPAFGALRLVTLLLSVRDGTPVERLAITSAVTGHIFHVVPFARKGGPETVEKPVPPDLPPFARVYEGMEGPVVAGQTAVVASRILKRAMAVDIPSGHLYWSTPLPAPTTGPGTVAGLLYVLPLRDRLLLVDLASGRVLFTLAVTGEPVPGSPPVVGTTLYLAERNGQVTAISLEKYRTLIFPPSSGTAGSPGARREG